MLGGDRRVASKPPEQFRRQLRISIEKPNEPGQRYWRNRRLRQRLDRVEGDVEAAVGDAREIPRKQEVEDLPLPVAQDAVANGDPIGDQEDAAAAFPFADDLLPGANGPADRFEVEKRGQSSATSGGDTNIFWLRNAFFRGGSSRVRGAWLPGGPVISDQDHAEWRTWRANAF